MQNKINLQYVEQALRFHGAPMQKIWDNERGADDLPTLGMPANPNYEIYQQRQRFFTFQDRAKRLKLHQFFARKATDLYDSDLKKYANIPDEKYLEKAKPSFATLPPYEKFAYDLSDKDRKCHAVLESLKPGDIVYAVICSKSPPLSSWPVKPLCTGEPVIRYLDNLPIKGVILSQDIGPLPLDENGKIRGYLKNDIIRCEVKAISIEVDRVFLGLKGELIKDSNAVLGLVKQADLPFYYTKTKENASLNYEQCLTLSKEFLNPNYEVLFSMNGLDINDTFSLMGALKQPFPQHEMAKELRKAQAHKWAFRSVAEGIELFKNGHHMEAFQCLNKALSIDPYNVEGLVARGALFANRGSFHKAVDDFGTALKLDKYHANARKYMGETLVALGRSLEEDKRLDEAAKAYKDCLILIPHHAQAMGCLEALNQRLTRNLLDNSFLDNLLNIPGSTTTTLKKQDSNFEILPNNEVVEANASKASNSSSSEDGSSDSESSDSDDATDANNAKTASSNFSKGSSLSPLSKRLALHAASLRGNNGAVASSINDDAPPPPPSSSANIASVRYDQPFFATRAKVADANDFRLDDDDTQTRVLKLIEEASAHKKDKKKKSKTKKSKSKKSKKSSSKKSKNNADDVATDMGQSLFQSNYLLQTFKNIGNENFQQKLSKDINSYEYKIAEIHKRQEMLRQSLTAGNAAAAKDESPPPPPPISLMGQTTSKIHINLSKPSNKQSTKPDQHNKQPMTSSSTLFSTSTSSAAAADAANRFSFQIKKPAKVDMFGLFRIATPLQQRSPSLTRNIDEGEKSRRRRDSRSRTRSPHRRHRRRSSKSRSRSRSRRRTRSRSRSRRSRSSSYYRGRNRRSRSRSKSRSKSRYRSRRDSRSRHRDSRSPYLKRRSRSKDDNYRRTDTKYWENRSVSRLTRSPKSKANSGNHVNRVWQRPGYVPPAATPKASDQRWQHDKFEEINSDQPSVAPKKEEGPSIEEIDEIINKAQKERKAEIIKRDKDILKRPNNGQY